MTIGARPAVACGQVLWTCGILAVAVLRHVTVAGGGAADLIPACHDALVHAAWVRVRTPYIKPTHNNNIGQYARHWHNSKKSVYEPPKEKRVQHANYARSRHREKKDVRYYLGTFTVFEGHGMTDGADFWLVNPRPILFFMSRCWTGLSRS